MFLVEQQQPFDFLTTKHTFTNRCQIVFRFKSFAVNGLNCDIRLCCVEHGNKHIYAETEQSPIDKANATPFHTTQANNLFTDRKSLSAHCHIVSSLSTRGMNNNLLIMKDRLKY
ncbi:CLUMA_CG021590, isoform A [Clunio marinus]|uniref:CLUMA_CG021590, isoform A n=1 Tax=Clunio marinus TaxID=568069 RepID=A0A1J1J8E0_9DIPT|nr:CLUMA_CG021590, isoform A [Clunio marinus]